MYDGYCAAKGGVLSMTLWKQAQCQTRLDLSGAPRARVGFDEAGLVAWRIRSFDRLNVLEGSRLIKVGQSYGKTREWMLAGWLDMRVRVVLRGLGAGRGLIALRSRC